MSLSQTDLLFGCNRLRWRIYDTAVFFCFFRYLSCDITMLEGRQFTSALQRHLQAMREDVLAEMVQQIEAEQSMGHWIPLLARIQTCIEAVEAVGRTAERAPDLGEAGG